MFILQIPEVSVSGLPLAYPYPVLSNSLTFVFFVLIGLEIREGLKNPREAILPGLCALFGMIVPALIFLGFHTGTPAWAVAMPTDVALAVGALSLLGRRVNPDTRIFLLTLAVADDLLSLLVIAIFFSSHLNLTSSIYTLGAAAMGSLLPFRTQLIKLLSPIVSFLVIPIYIWINLLSHLDFGAAGGKISVALVLARVIGKVVGISTSAWLLTKFTRLRLPNSLHLKEVIGVGFLAGMGLTVSIVIAKITLTTQSQLAEVKIGLFIAAVISGLLGTLWLLVTRRTRA